MTEGSAGSTAISLATVAPAFGCRCHVVIPDDAAIEKVFLFSFSTYFTINLSMMTFICAYIDISNIQF